VGREGYDRWTEDRSSQEERDKGVPLDDRSIRTCTKIFGDNRTRLFIHILGKGNRSPAFARHVFISCESFLALHLTFSSLVPFHSCQPSTPGHTALESSSMLTVAVSRHTFHIVASPRRNRVRLLPITSQLGLCSPPRKVPIDPPDQSPLPSAPPLQCFFPHPPCPTRSYPRCFREIVSFGRRPAFGTCPNCDWIRSRSVKQHPRNSPLLSLRQGILGVVFIRHREVVLLCLSVFASAWGEGRVVSECFTSVDMWWSMGCPTSIATLRGCVCFIHALIAHQRVEH
jgi:hypothetical protein